MICTKCHTGIKRGEDPVAFVERHRPHNPKWASGWMRSFERQERDVRGYSDEVLVAMVKGYQQAGYRHRRIAKLLRAEVVRREDLRILRAMGLRESE